MATRNAIESCGVPKSESDPFDASLPLCCWSRDSGKDSGLPCCNGTSGPAQWDWLGIRVLHTYEMRVKLSCSRAKVHLTRVEDAVLVQQALKIAV